MPAFKMSRATPFSITALTFWYVKALGIVAGVSDSKTPDAAALAKSA